MKNNPLLFFTNNDIPFPSAKMIIHNPTINELGLIGEESFRIALQMILHLPKDIKSQDNFASTDKEDFDIFIEMINQKDERSIEYKNYFSDLLSLIFPKYTFRIKQKDIQFLNKMEEDKDNHFIDSTNFKEFCEIISKMFSSNGAEPDKSYKPADKRASMIAEKLKKRKKGNGQDIDTNSISVYKRYASIMSIGMQMDLNVFLNYTVNQLETQFKRYTLWMKYDNLFKIKLAGGSSEEEIEDWMQEV